MIEVIGFYPGGGGNRFARYIAGLEYDQPNTTYDELLSNQHFINRYLSDGAIIDKDLVLTHCLNANHIRSLIPNCNITFLISDLKQSLHREWKLKGHNRFRPDDSNIRIEHYNAIKAEHWPDVTSERELNSLPVHIKIEVNDMFDQLSNLINPNGEHQHLLSAFATISWHNDYYKNYPVDMTNVTIIDIDKDNSPFTKVMQKELTVCIDPIFELAWDSYGIHGKDAELTKIYEQYKK